MSLEALNKEEAFLTFEIRLIAPIEVIQDVLKRTWTDLQLLWDQVHNFTFCTQTWPQNYEQI